MAEFTSGIPFIGKNKVISTISSDWGGRFKYAYALCHAGGYYGLNNGCVHRENYEAGEGWDYFPVDFLHDRPGRIDYVVAWRIAPDSNDIKLLEWGRELIHETPNLKLYREKPVGSHSFFVEKLSEARVWSNSGDTFQWKNRCSNNISYDHFVRGGWEGTKTRDFIAHTVAMIKGKAQEGLLMLANPDGEMLSVKWDVNAHKGSTFWIRYALTDAAVERTTNGLEFTIFTVRNDGTKKVLLKDRIESGDATVRERIFTFDTFVKAICVVHDNLGKEFWDVLYIDPHLEIAEQ